MNRRFIIVLLISSLLAYFSSCNKEHSDFRLNYIGEWAFTTYFTDYSLVVGILEADTIFCIGAIELGDAENELIVYFTESWSYIINVNPDGKVENHEFGVYDYFGGAFDGYNKFHFLSNSGDLSHRHKTEIFGERN